MRNLLSLPIRTRPATGDVGALPDPSRATGPFQIGTSRLPCRGRRWIGLLLLGLLVLPWLPIFGPPVDLTPTMRVGRVGDAPILRFRFSPDGATIAILHTDGRVSLRGTAGVAIGHAFLDHRGSALAFSPDGRVLAVGGDGSDLFLYEVGSGKAGYALGMPIRFVSAVTFSPDGLLLAASSTLDHEIVLWDLAAGRERARLRGHGSPVTSLVFDPEGRSLASSALRDTEILVWDLANCRPRRRLGVPNGGTLALVYSPDGGWLASTCVGERPVRLWDLDGSRGDRLIGSHSCRRDPVAFSRDGRLLATVGDGIIRLWDVATGAELRQVRIPNDRLTGVAFSPDGRLLAASTDDADIGLWDLERLRDGSTPR